MFMHTSDLSLIGLPVTGENVLLLITVKKVSGILLPERSNLFESHWSNQWLTHFS